MNGVSEVPVVEVHASNIIELWPSLVHAIRSSTFVAIDTVSLDYCLRVGIKLVQCLFQAC